VDWDPSARALALVPSERPLSDIYGASLITAPLGMVAWGWCLHRISRVYLRVSRGCPSCDFRQLMSAVDGPRSADAGPPPPCIHVSCLCVDIFFGWRAPSAPRRSRKDARGRAHP